MNFTGVPSQNEEGSFLNRRIQYLFDISDKSVTIMMFVFFNFLAWIVMSIRKHYINRSPNKRRETA